MRELRAESLPELVRMAEKMGIPSAVKQPANKPSYTNV